MNAEVVCNLAWKLNWSRQSELEGALLLGRMVGAIEDGDLAAKLTRHCAEEAEHSRVWSDVIAELDLPHIRIFRSYQSFYLRHSGPPACLLDVLCFTQVFERRVNARFHDELHRLETPAAARRAYRRMIEDERNHLGWVAEWLREQPGAAGGLNRYRKIDRLVFSELNPFEERLWAIPGLGRDCPPQPLPAS
jgi:rubrerythrin